MAFLKVSYKKKSVVDAFTPGVWEEGESSLYWPVTDFSQVSKGEVVRLCKKAKISFKDNRWLSAIYFVKNLFGPHPHLAFMEARYKHERALRARLRAAKQQRHEENQHNWFEKGGRSAAYRAKNPFGRMTNKWFVEGVERVVHASVGDGVEAPEEEWDPLAKFEDLKLWLSGADHASARSKRAVRNAGLYTRSDCAQSRSGSEMRVSTPASLKKRSVVLLWKLRAYARILRHCTLVQYQNFNIRKNVAPVTKTKLNDIFPESDGVSQGGVSEVKTSNVVLTESQNSSDTVAAENTFSYDWHPLCSTEKTSDYSYLTDRFTYFKTLQWKKENNQGTELKDSKFELPKDFINVSDGSMPMFVPFKIHRYFASDIHIKLHMNSNKFQVGQIQVSFQYLEKYDGNKLDNIYSRSQLPHVLLNAGSSNEATLVIPFKYVQPYMFTKTRTDNLDALYLGTLRFFVVAPLEVAAGGPDCCSISVFISLPNARFTGLCDGSLPVPEMEAAATAMIATAVYDKFIGDKNCDNRTQNANPNYIIPTATHSWSAGTGLREKLHSLRLDNSTQGVGRTGIDDSETSIGIPARVFGMLKSVSWSMTTNPCNTTGTQLFSCDVHPQIQKDLCYKIATDKKMDKYALPPVSVVASLYRQWRGSLEFKFDIIKSQFHTGRLLCCYIPGFYGDAQNVTLAMARNSAHAEFDIAEESSFTFVVPYIAPTVWWSRRYTGPHKYGEENSPSKLILFVLNPLIPMQSVVQSVKIIPYVRAGEDFEVSVPVQPSVGLSDCIDITVPMFDKIKPTKGSYPWYTTNYEGWLEDKYCILYEGTSAFGTACTFDVPPLKYNRKTQSFYGKFDTTDKTGYINWEVVDPVTKVKSKVAGRVFFLSVYSTDKGWFGIPFNDELRCKQFTKCVALKKDPSVFKKYVYEYVSDGAPSSANLNELTATCIIFNLADVPLTTEDDTDVEWSDLQPEINPRVMGENILQPTSSLSSTSAGNFNFNEQFSDLKDLCRRYQLYGECKLKIPQTYDSNESVLFFPVIPHGLKLDISDSEGVFNICRDGHIPIVSSGYIYFRGSIRFRIVLSSDSIHVSGLKVWVQHHPDGDCMSHQIQAYPQITVEDRIKSHTYSFYVQSVKINSVVEFEVPFYQPGMYGITRPPSTDCPTDVCQYYSLGNISCGFDGGIINSGFDCSVKIYYSIGDDFSFNVFRGFPMMVFTDEIWTAKARAMKQLDKSLKDSDICKRLKRRVTQISDILPEMEDVKVDTIEPEIFECITNYFSNTVKKTILDTVDELATKATDIISQEYEKMLAFSRTHQQIRTKLFNRQTFISAVSGLMFIAVNPDPRTIALAIAQFLAVILDNCLTDVLTFASKIGEMLISSWHLFVDKMYESEDSGNLTKHVSAVCGIVFTSVASMFGYACCAPDKMPNILRDINTSVSLMNNLTRLLQNCGELVEYCITYISGKMYPDIEIYLKLQKDVPDIKKWYEECQYLLDVRNRSRYLYDRALLARVFDACTFGNLLMAAGVNRSFPAGKLMCDVHRDIRKLQTDLFERGAHPDVRFEPFPIWITGQPGIGKSYLVTHLCNSLLKSVHFQQPGSLIYYVPAGAKYWSGCQNPAVLVSDDMFQVSGVTMEEEIKQVFAICSSSVLNPPMAAVEEKSRRLNPLLYIMLCNHAFPNLSPTSITPEAFFRRRKFLIDVRIKDEILEKYPNFRDASQLTREEKQDFDHLQFRYAFNVKEHSEDNWSEWRSYKEIFELISEDFKEHYVHERQNFKQRMHLMYCLDPNFNEDNLVYDMPTEIDQTQSLKDQLAEMKELAAMELDDYNDPNREHTRWERAGKKFSEIKNYIKEKILPEMDTEELNGLKAAWANEIQQAVLAGVDPMTILINDLTLDDNGSTDIVFTDNQSCFANNFPLLSENFKFQLKKITSSVESHPLIKIVSSEKHERLLYTQLGLLTVKDNAFMSMDLMQSMQHFFSLINISYRVESTTQATNSGRQVTRTQTLKTTHGTPWVTTEQCRIFELMLGNADFSIEEMFRFLIKFPQLQEALICKFLFKEANDVVYKHSRNRDRMFAHFADQARADQLFINHYPVGSLERYYHKLYEITNAHYPGGNKLLLLQVQKYTNRTLYSLFMDLCITKCIDKHFQFHADLGTRIKERLRDEHVLRHAVDVLRAEDTLSSILEICIEFMQEYKSAGNAAMCKILFEFVLHLQTLNLVACSLFEPNHTCSTQRQYTLINSSERLSKLTFCNETREFIYDGVSFSSCKHNCCIYQCDIMLYWFGLCADTCSAPGIIAGKSDLYPDHPEVLHYPNRMMILNCLKSRKRFKSQGLFDRFVRTGRHLVFHKLPSTIWHILDFLCRHMWKILIVMSVMNVIRIFYFPDKTYPAIVKDLVHELREKYGENISNFTNSAGQTIADVFNKVSGMRPKFKLFGASASAIYENAYPEGNYFKFDGVRHHKQPRAMPDKNFIRPEMSANNRVVLHNKINRNFVKMHVSWHDDEKRESRGCNCLMLRGRSLLVLRHYLEEYEHIRNQGFDLDIKLMFQKNKNGDMCSVSVSWQELQKVAWCSNNGSTITSNFGIIKLPNYVPEFPDIVKYIAPKDQHKNMSSMIDLYVLAGQNLFDMPVTIKNNFTISDTPTSSGVSCEIGYSYRTHGRGMCGSVVVSPNLGSGLGAIVGMHVAGSNSTGTGYSEPMYREMFERFFDIHPERKIVDFQLAENDIPDFELNSNVLTLGVVDSKYAHKETGKSKIVPSLMYDRVYPHVTEVNPLRPNDPRQPPGSHPLRDGCEKHGTGNVTVFDPEMVETVEMHMKERITTIMRPVRAIVQPLTMQQATCGDTDLEYFEPLNWKSSEGFPLKASRPTSAHDKRWLFDLQEGQFGYKLLGIAKELEIQMRIRDKCFEQNIKPHTVYIDCLKDYRLKPEKCAEPGKTRIFSIAPIQCSLDVRMHLTDFTASLKKNRIRNSIGIGINPDSMEWTDLVNYLFEVGTKIITLDYKNFGPCLMSQMVAAGNRVISHWFDHYGASPEHVKRVEWLLDCDILNPVHLAGNVLYQTVNGISSGSPLTGECNSIPNLFYIRLTFLEIMKENCPQFADMWYFDAMVRVVVYGDDLIMSIDDSLEHLFNALTIKEYLGRHGITVTPASKDSEMVPFTSIYEATFLKRSFKEHPFRKGIWLGPIEKNSIQECINWCHISDNMQEATLECVRASMDLAYSQGPEYYAQHRKRMIDELATLNLSLDIKSWYLRDREIFESDSSPSSAGTIPWFYQLAKN